MNNITYDIVDKCCDDNDSPDSLTNDTHGLIYKYLIHQIKKQDIDDSINKENDDFCS